MLADLDLQSACRCPRLTARIGPFVSHFKGLTALDLAFSDSMTGQITEYLGALTSLQNLSLSHCELVTSENIGAISELTSLRFLDLSATRVGHLRQNLSVFCFIKA